jgi:hypothetical protein
MKGMRWKCRREEKQKPLFLSPWKAQKTRFPHSHRIGCGHILKPKTGANL